MSSPHTRSSTKGHVFRCKVCSKGFSKAEHLQRHERIHTGVKPFVCPTCGRQFGRADSLTRHVRTHNKQNPTQPSSSPPDLIHCTSDTLHNGNGMHSFIDQAAMPQDDGSTVATGDRTFSTSIAEFDTSLQWPDSEKLLHTIVSSDWNSLALPPGVIFPQLDGDAEVTTPELGSEYHQDLPQPTGPSMGSYMAIHSLSSMITNTSSRVTSAVEMLPELTPTFLDNCLQNYFSSFNPFFPVLHQPTFKFRECSPSLLLNAIALGSLFIGTEDAVSKGEALWRLAYTAVATSWQHLMLHKGVHDRISGIQLVLAALLGQSYAILSKNENLRVTSQIYHILGFKWAKYCNMLDPHMYELSDLLAPSPGTAAEKETAWRRWVSRETGLRSLLGHYILLGQLDRSSGESSVGEHTFNPLVLSARRDLFEKQTAEEWFQAFEGQDRTTVSFRKVYADLFKPNGSQICLTKALGSSYSTLDLRVILDCVHSLVCETRNPAENHPIITFPSKSQVKVALLRIYNHLETQWSNQSVEQLELMLQWHLTCLKVVMDPMELCSQLCRHFRVEQHLCCRTDKSEPEQSILDWTRLSTDAKRTLLHAAAIDDLAAQLPLSHTLTMWMPTPIFAAAITYIAFCLGGISTVILPSSVDWGTVLGSTAPVSHVDGLSTKNNRENTRIFLSSDLRIPIPSLGHSRSLFYRASSLQAMVASLSVQWGVCQEMGSILRALRLYCG